MSTTGLSREQSFELNINTNVVVKIPGHKGKRRQIRGNVGRSLCYKRGGLTLSEGYNLEEKRRTRNHRQKLTLRLLLALTARAPRLDSRRHFLCSRQTPACSRPEDRSSACLRICVSIYCRVVSSIPGSDPGVIVYCTMHTFCLI